MGDRERARRQVRVFVASTFEDLHAERDLLVTRVFPELRARLAGRGCALWEVDLRWGVPEGRPDPWPDCRAAVDRADIVLGMLGDRYGSVIPDDERELPEGAHGRSYTELELRRAAGRAGCRLLLYRREPAGEDARLRELHRWAAEHGARTWTATPGGGPPDELEGRLVDDLWAILDPWTAGGQPGSADVDGRRAAAEARALYTGRGRAIRALRRHAREPDGQLLVLHGPTGIGKTTILSRLAGLLAPRGPAPRRALPAPRHGRARSPRVHAPKLVACFVEHAPDCSTSENLHRRLGAALDGAGTPELRLARLLDQGSGRPVVLVIDAIDALDGDRGLGWIPRTLPRGVSVIVSTSWTREELARNDPLHARRSLRLLRLGGLGLQARGRLVDRWLDRHCKSMTPGIRAALCALPGAANPLYLRVLLGELRQVRRLLDAPPRGGTAGEVVVAGQLASRFPDLATLYGWVVENAARHCDPAGDAARRWLTRLGLGRRGWTAEELVLATAGPEGAAVARRLERYLLSHLADRGGRLLPAHSAFRDALRRWVGPDLAGAHAEVALELAARMDLDDERGLPELAYHLDAAGRNEALWSLARDARFLDRLGRAGGRQAVIDTLTLARDAACRAGRVGEVVDLLVRPATVLDALGRANPAQSLRCAGVEAAWAAAALHPAEREWRWLVQIAWSVVAEPLRARSTLVRVLDRARSPASGGWRPWRVPGRVDREPGWWVQPDRWLARALADLGTTCPDEVVALARSGLDDPLRVALVAELASARARRAPGAAAGGLVGDPRPGEAGPPGPRDATGHGSGLIERILGAVADPDWRAAGAAWVGAEGAVPVSTEAWLGWVEALAFRGAAAPIFAGPQGPGDPAVVVRGHLHALHALLLGGGEVPALERLLEGVAGLAPGPVVLAPWRGLDGVRVETAAPLAWAVERLLDAALVPRNPVSDRDRARGDPLHGLLDLAERWLGRLPEELGEGPRGRLHAQRVPAVVDAPDLERRAAEALADPSPRFRSVALAGLATRHPDPASREGLQVFAWAAHREAPADFGARTATAALVRAWSRAGEHRAALAGIRAARAWSRASQASFDGTDEDLRRTGAEPLAWLRDVVVDAPGPDELADRVRFLPADGRAALAAWAAALVPRPDGPACVAVALGVEADEGVPRMEVDRAVGAPGLDPAGSRRLDFGPLADLLLRLEDWRRSRPRRWTRVSPAARRGLAWWLLGFQRGASPMERAGAALLTVSLAAILWVGWSSLPLAALGVAAVLYAAWAWTREEARGKEPWLGLAARLWPSLRSEPPRGPGGVHRTWGPADGLREGLVVLTHPEVDAELLDQRWMPELREDRGPTGAHLWSEPDAHPAWDATGSLLHLATWAAAGDPGWARKAWDLAAQRCPPAQAPDHDRVGWGIHSSALPPAALVDEAWLVAAAAPLVGHLVRWQRLDEALDLALAVPGAPGLRFAVAEGWALPGRWDGVVRALTRTAGRSRGLPLDAVVGGLVDRLVDLGAVPAARQLVRDAGRPALADRLERALAARAPGPEYPWPPPVEAAPGLEGVDALLPSAVLEQPWDAALRDGDPDGAVSAWLAHPAAPHDSVAAFLSDLRRVIPGPAAGAHPAFLRALGVIGGDRRASLAAVRVLPGWFEEDAPTALSELVLSLERELHRLDARARRPTALSPAELAFAEGVAWQHSAIALYERGASGRAEAHLDESDHQLREARGLGFGDDNPGELALHEAWTALTRARCALAGGDPLRARGLLLGCRAGLDAHDLDARVEHRLVVADAGLELGIRTRDGDPFVEAIRALDEVLLLLGAAPGPWESMATRRRARAWRVAGDLAAALGCPPEALRAWRLAAEVGLQWERLVGLRMAEAAARLGDLDDARASLREQARVTPGALAVALRGFELAPPADTGWWLEQVWSTRPGGDPEPLVSVLVATTRALGGEVVDPTALLDRLARGGDSDRVDYDWEPLRAQVVGAGFPDPFRALLERAESRLTRSPWHGIPAGRAAGALRELLARRGPPC